jgi:hypothetical protein
VLANRSAVTLTLTVIPGCSACQPAATRQASSSTQPSSSPTSPTSSASGTKAFGASSPRRGWFQRTSASKPASRPDCKQTIG